MTPNRYPGLVGIGDAVPERSAPDICRRTRVLTIDHDVAHAKSHGVQSCIISKLRDVGWDVVGLRSAWRDRPRKCRRVDPSAARAAVIIGEVDRGGKTTEADRRIDE